MNNNRDRVKVPSRTTVLIATLATVLYLVPNAKCGSAPRLSRDWIVVFRDNLQNSVLQFWIDHGVDREYGGAYGWLDRQGRPIPPGTKSALLENGLRYYSWRNRDIPPGSKSLVLEARTMWSFSEAYRRYPLPAYKKIATDVHRFLHEKMWDSTRGGYYALVDREGHVIDDTKLLNPMSYVLEGLVEYSLAFQDPQVRQEALDLFELIDRVAHDDVNGGYHTALTADWRPIEGYQPGPNASGSYGRKSSDWHLGLLEAFSTLYDLTGDPLVRRRVEELLDLFLDKMIEVPQGHLIYYFTGDWKPADRAGDSKQSMYGLEMETSWLIAEAGELVGRETDPKLRRASLSLVDHTLRSAFDNVRGGIYLDGPAEGPPFSKRKTWWQQAEALVGFLNAYELSADKKYWDAFEKQARFVSDDFTDHTYGGWYTSIAEDGSIDASKAGPVRAQYHETRACLEIIRRLGGTL